MKKLVVTLTDNTALTYTLAKKPATGRVLYGALAGKLFIFTAEGEQTIGLSSILGWEEVVATATRTNKYQRELDDATAELDTLLKLNHIDRDDAASIAYRYESYRLAVKALARHNKATAKAKARDEAKKAKTTTAAAPTEKMVTVTAKSSKKAKDTKKAA